MTSSITFHLSSMNAVQLAKLYKLLLSLFRMDEAHDVYEIGVANCGAEEFCLEVARA